jgi:hypothetical protein
MHERPPASAGGTSLFSAEARVARPLAPTLSEFQQLEQAADGASERVRALMDDWFQRVPPEARPQIRERFRRDTTPDHRGAFWEMYLHTAGVLLGFEVGVDIGNDTSGERRPDFAFAGTSDAFHVEATVVLGDDVVPRGTRPRVQQLRAVLEGLTNPNFYVHVKVRQVGAGTPGAKLASRVDGWLAGLDPDAQLDSDEDGPVLPAWRLDDDGWILDLTAGALQPELRGRTDLRGVGSWQEGFDLDDDGNASMHKMRDVDPIGKSLRSKANHKYVTDGHPLIVAVLCISAFASEREVAQALLGPIKYRWSPTGSCFAGEYTGGGLWLDEKQRPRNTRMSAVLTALNLRPSGVAVVEPVLWTNPWAPRPVRMGALPWRTNEFARDGTITTHEATRTVADIFGIGTHWPAVC